MHRAKGRAVSNVLELSMMDLLENINFKIVNTLRLLCRSHLRTHILDTCSAASSDHL